MPSLIFQPITVTHPWIEEDLIYISVDKRLGLIILVAVVKASLAEGTVNCITWNFSYLVV